MNKKDLIPLNFSELKNFKYPIIKLKESEIDSLKLNDIDLINKSKIFFPKNDKDNPPINVMINNAINISSPGISKGK